MLRFNESNGAFLLYTHDTKAAMKAGLTLSTKVRGPEGEAVYFTAGANMQPDFNPYAVLEFHNEADEACRDRLAPLLRDYRSSWDDDVDRQFPSPPGYEYLPYQRAGINYAIGRQHCLIGDAPGLGKTIQGVGVANALNAGRVLIVCPASIRRHWRAKVREWSTIPHVRVNAIESGSQGVSHTAHFNVISYDLLRNPGVHAALRAMNFDLAIFDEAHYLKSVGAQRTRAIFGGGEAGSQFHKNGLNLNIERMVGLTGTYLPNRPREAYMLARGFNWESIDYMSQDAFEYRFNPSAQIAKVDPLTGREFLVNVEAKGRLAELNARLRCNFMVRRLKEDVLDQLPDKRYEMTYVETNGAIREVLAKESLIDFDPNVLFNPDFSLDGTPISTLRREMGEAMVPTMVDYLRYQLDIVGHPKLIAFAHHTSVIEELMDRMSKYGPVVQKGGMTDTAKERAKSDFINNPDCRLYIGQLDTMEGVDGLQSVCSDVVFCEPAWNPGRNEQCVDRVHRIGQHDNCVAHFLLVEGSFNEKVLNTVLEKAEHIHESLDRRIT